MSLLEKIEQDLPKAQKGKKELELSTLRLLKTALKNAEIAKRPTKLSENDEIRVIHNEAKKHLDSIEMFQRGNRQDLVEREEKELKIIRRYLPKEMSDKELLAVVEKIISASGAQGVQDSGRVTGAVMKEIRGRADGKRVEEMVKKFLISNA